MVDSRRLKGGANLESEKHASKLGAFAIGFPATSSTSAAVPWSPGPRRPGHEEQLLEARRGSGEADKAAPAREGVPDLRLDASETSSPPPAVGSN